MCSNIETLKNEYIDTIKPFDKDYYISWLNIRKNQIVTLDLEIEELEEIGNTDTTKIVFESSNEHITVNRPSIKLSELTLPY